MRRALEALRTDLDPLTLDAAAAEWQAAIHTPVWARPGVWIDGGRLSAIIDWGGLGVSDPACDLMVARTFLDAPRARCSVPPPMWTTRPERAVAGGHYRWRCSHCRTTEYTNHSLVAISNSILGEVLGTQP